MTRNETIKGNPGLRRCRAAVAAVVFALLLPLLFPFPAAANAPAEVLLSYDAGTRTLEVRITHPSSSPQRHYIEKVEIVKNGSWVSEAEYKSQPPDQGTYSYSYPLEAAPGDVLEAKAICSISGSKTGKLTVR
jgi:hypothetical protein